MIWGTEGFFFYRGGLPIQVAVMTGFTVSHPWPWAQSAETGDDQFTL